jgi:dCTP diphosphatase
METTATAPPSSEPYTGQPFAAGLSLEDLRCAMATFVAERDWHKFHTPRNVLLALVGEAGEVAELFQWKGEVKRGAEAWSASEHIALGQELSDVLLYLVRLADLTGVDLASAATNKMALNRAKYPADKCRGSSAKYTAYAEGSTAATTATTIAPAETSWSVKPTTTAPSASASTGRAIAFPFPPGTDTFAMGFGVGCATMGLVAGITFAFWASMGRAATR